MLPVEEYKSTLNIDTEAGDQVDENLEITLQPQTSVVVMDQYTGQVKAIVGRTGQEKEQPFTESCYRFNQAARISF